MAEMRIFQLVRSIDPTGISGTGIVADGCVFPNGKVCLCWRGNLSSIVIHESLDNVIKIHGHNGPNPIHFIIN